MPVIRTREGEAPSEPPPFLPLPSAPTRAACPLSSTHVGEGRGEGSSAVLHRLPIPQTNRHAQTLSPSPTTPIPGPSNQNHGSTPSRPRSTTVRITCATASNPNSTP